MVLELHVWGPAFSLPSIEPQCLAAIAYLAEVVPRDQWVLFPSSNTALSPTRELPALRDGSSAVLIGGFQNIVEYLRKISNGKWDLDCHFSNPRERADITAFSSLILSHAQPLLDLNLYVSSENYSNITRPSYTRILQWPSQFLIPPAHRSLAQTRTQHLGLSYLDLDTLNGSENSRKKPTDLVPPILRTTRQTTVTSLVKQTHTPARFRLDTLVDALCEPLTQLLQNKAFFFSDTKPSSLDCLALAYLSLALKPAVAQAWLAQGMRSRHGILCDWVDGRLSLLFGESHAPSVDKIDTVASTAMLPWTPPPQRTIGSALLDHTLQALPFYPQSNILITTSSSTNEKPTQRLTSNNNITPSHSFPSKLPPLLATLGAGAAIIAGYFVYAGVDRQEPEKHKLEDMGEAGAMLAGIDFGGTGF